MMALVVENDPNSLFMIRRTLIGLKFNVETHENAEPGMGSVFRPDIMLLSYPAKLHLSRNSQAFDYLSAVPFIITRKPIKPLQIKFQLMKRKIIPGE